MTEFTCHVKYIIIENIFPCIRDTDTRVQKTRVLLRSLDKCDSTSLLLDYIIESCRYKIYAFKINFNTR